MNYIRGLAQDATDLGVCATAGDSWSLRSWSDSFSPPGHLPGSSGKVAAPKQIIPRLKQGRYGLPALPPRRRSTCSSSGWTGDRARPRVDVPLGHDDASPGQPAERASPVALGAAGSPGRGGAGVEDRINTAYLYGGIQQATAVMENLTGIAIDRYAIVDFGGFEDAIDALGGVTLEVEQPIRIGIDGRRVYIPAGRQELDGLEALAYARYRGTACGDLDRIRRQQRLVAALREQALGWNTITKIPGIVRVAHENVDTNLGIVQAISLGRALVGRGEEGGMRSYQLKGNPEILPNGDAVLVPDEPANERSSRTSATTAPRRTSGTRRRRVTRAHPPSAQKLAEVLRRAPAETTYEGLFTRVTLLWSSGAAPGGDLGLLFWTRRRGTGAARDQHAVDLPGYVALEAADDLSLALALRGAPRDVFLRATDLGASGTGRSCTARGWLPGCHRG